GPTLARGDGHAPVPDALRVRASQGLGERGLEHPAGRGALVHAHALAHDPRSGLARRLRQNVRAMKVTGVETCVLTVPTQKPIALEFAHHKLVIAQIATDEGITGLGYSLAFGGGGAEAIKVYLDTRLAPLVIGQHPLFVERLWERRFRVDRGLECQGAAAYAISPLAMRLWGI